MNCYVSQAFGENAVDYYKNAGLKGHTGEDIHCGYGTPIYSEYDGYVYKVLDANRPARDGSGYYGVFIIVDNGVQLFEYEIGHCIPSVDVGDTIKKGQIIGTEANRGSVWSGGVKITRAMQDAGDKRGSHRHIQVRPLIKGKDVTGRLLTKFPGGSYKDKEGYYYKIADYNNGFNGCVNKYAPLFQRDLTVGMEGYDVYCLQRFLKTQGLAPYEATGYFGKLTKLSVTAYQLLNGIKPAQGYFGPLTRASIDNKIKKSYT